MTVTVLHPEPAAGGRPHGLTRFKHGPDENGQPGAGCHCPVCTQASRDYDRHRVRMIAYGRWQPPVDATGTRRRIQALMRNGWPLASLGRHLGITRQSARQMLTYARVSTRTAEAVRALYDDLWDQAPPERDRIEKRAATITRRDAATRGWPPPLAWDDDTIDDPAATPAEGWERRDGTRRYWGELAKEAADLLGWGEHPDMAAQRLGVSRVTLDQALRRAQRRAEAADAA